MPTPTVLDLPETPDLLQQKQSVSFQSQSASTRFYYMDSMRSILMMLGVVLHGALIYSSGDHWIVSDSHKSEFFAILDSVIHAFRMPAFFIIAGFFSMMSLKKYGIGTFTRVRLTRILVPLFCTALFINSIELYFRSTILQHNPMTVTHFLTQVLPQKWIAGEWVSHLWFLLTLVQFFAVGIILFALKNHFSRFSHFDRYLGGLRKNCYFLFLLPLADISWSVAARLAPDIFHGSLFCGFLNLEDFMIYLPYYLVGLWLFHDRLLQNEFHTIARWEWGALVLAILTHHLLENAHGLSQESFLRIYSTGLIFALSSHICYVLFYKFMNRDSPVFRYLSDASYSIYLFHHLCVIVIGYLLLNVQIAIGYKFLTVELATIAITLSIHHFLILRIKTLRFMFNGK